MSLRPGQLPKRQPQSAKNVENVKSLYQVAPKLGTLAPIAELGGVMKILPEHQRQSTNLPITTTLTYILPHPQSLITQTLRQLKIIHHLNQTHLRHTPNK